MRDFLDYHKKSRMDLLHEAASGECECGDRWIPAATQLLDNNGIAQVTWRNAMLDAFTKGRKKGYVVTTSGSTARKGSPSFLSHSLVCSERRTSS